MACAADNNYCGLNHPSVSRGNYYRVAPTYHLVVGLQLCDLVRNVPCPRLWWHKY